MAAAGVGGNNCVAGRLRRAALGTAFRSDCVLIRGRCDDTFGDRFIRCRWRLYSIAYPRSLLGHFFVVCSGFSRVCRIGPSRARGASPGVFHFFR
jgi:hypothetical protein